ncbi:uncharacterized protein LOC124913395 [Impatiens glandulifera]|uniref:uncharacterized protein LOC124913395 n=1 Tax=Impatiens glandulifera TaxID=253017 RepID=UPI001FB0BFBC|nr:uncharacterized protein LOC124913395 [Impatiens glandulifera]
MADVHLWKVEENGKIKSSAIWNVIRERGQIVSWASLVWSLKIIPRHRFIFWLSFRGRLSTRDRIRAYMDIPDANCVLCSGFAESIDHLLGGCFFARSIWNLFTVAMGICEFAAIVYHLWAERNARVFGRVRRNVDHVLSDIVFDCGALIRTWRRVPKGGREWVLCHE